jgi:hypothetical protein
MTSRLRSTPARLLALLLAADCGLFVCNWFRWTPKGYAVLLSIAAVGAYLLVLSVWWLAALLFRGAKSIASIGF